MTRQIGSYDVVAEIGRGGMAVVYLARQSALERDVALKELSSFHALDPSFAERFAREARVGGALSHPNIVTVLEAFEHDGVPYIAMEYLERGSLRPLVGRLSLSEIAGVLEGLLAGLDYASNQGVVHRDLKPENVLVSAEGRVKIADFGVAKAFNQAWTAQFRTATGMALGTPTYMAPEQAMGADVSTRSDLYAVGIMAYELLAGQPPFSHLQEPMAVLMHHVSEPVPPLAQVAPTTEPRLGAWVMSLLEKDPNARPENPQAAWETLEDIVLSLLGPRWRRDARIRALGGAHDERPLTPAPFLEGEPTVAATAPPTPVEPPPPPPPPRRRRRAPLIGGAVALVAVIAVAAVLLTRGSDTPSGTSASAAAGIPACFGKGVIEAPTGIETDVVPYTKAVGKTYTFVLADHAPVGAVTVTVHGGGNPYYELKSVRGLDCKTLHADVYGEGGNPNFQDYSHVRASYAGKPYDLALSKDNATFQAYASMPKPPDMHVSAKRANGKVTVTGTIPNADGEVDLTYKATAADGTPIQRSATATLENGAFSVSAAAPPHAGAGTITARYTGNGNFLATTATATVESGA